MKEHPILFTSDMIRAIMDGRKTQTRMVVKPQWQGLPLENADYAREALEKCPYGVPGDRLWARETWQHGPEDCVYYLADNDPNENGWRPSIHMPRWASRITLEVTDVCVQRVQEITEGDAQAEGIQKPLGSQFWQVDPRANVLPADTPKLAFENFWDSINAKRGYGWDKNPWVWAITFKTVSINRGGAA